VQGCKSSSSDSDDESSGCRLKLIQAVRERSNRAVVESLLLDAATHEIDVAAVCHRPGKGNTLLHLALAKKMHRRRPLRGSRTPGQDEYRVVARARMSQCCRFSKREVLRPTAAAATRRSLLPRTIACFQCASCCWEAVPMSTSRSRTGFLTATLFSPLLYAAKNASHNSGVKDQSALGQAAPAVWR